MSTATANEIELARQGKDYYRHTLRAKLEPEHNGEYLVLDVGTGEYELDGDELAALRRARAKKPRTVFYILRVGYPTVGRI